jgi:threonylcarbamoyladenosine tRNA methylthiotransferase MtaB
MYPVALYTLGCKLNQLESEAIADSFRKAGFTPVSRAEEMQGPGIIIVNTCTVTSKADQKCRRLIRKTLRDHPDSCVIVTGCYARLDSQEIALLEPQAGLQRLFVLGAAAFGGYDSGAGAGAAKSPLLSLPEYMRTAMETVPSGTLPQVLESWIESVRFSQEDSFDFRPEQFSFHSRGYLKIQDGCDNRCNYCRVRLARGPSVSLSAQAALDQIRSAETHGCPELMVTGVNITQYNHCGFDLAGLLEYVLKESDDIALRLASLEPERITERLAAVLAHPRIRPHFHLSVQSGSDAILQAMGRAYTARTVEEGIALLRAAKDNPFLACDIIAGFPGETAAAFEQTHALCARIGFAWIHAFPYSKRPGTPAFSLGDSVCEREVKRRVESLTRLALEGRRNYAQVWLGRELSAVVENGLSPAGQCRAVTENYLKLMVQCSDVVPPPGSVIRCTPVSLCSGGDGENPDALAVL